MSDNDGRSAWQMQCPVPLTADSELVMLAHGEGGRLMRRLIQERIVSRLDSGLLRSMDDAAKLLQSPASLAVTTDSYVVSPLFFPGGDIGSMSVFGTTNDLVVSGARPLYLTLSLILEEGFPLAVLDRVIESVAAAAKKTKVQVVSGDTKVVPRGAADGLYINTTGLGALIDPIPPGPLALQEGDELIVSGPVGRHGVAVLCAREELLLEPLPQSDSGSLQSAVDVLRSAVGDRIHAMRDATRGGVTAVLHEWAQASQKTLAINETDLPVSAEVRGACELLGIDPIHIANEGTMVVAVQRGAADDAIAALRSIPETSMAAHFGTVVARQGTPVTIARALGRPQPLDELQGAALPRIC